MITNLKMSSFQRHQLGFNTPVGIVTEGTTNSKFTIGYGVSLQ